MQVQKRSTVTHAFNVFLRVIQRGRFFDKSVFLDCRFNAVLQAEWSEIEFLHQDDNTPQANKLS